MSGNQRRRPSLRVIAGDLVQETARQTGAAAVVRNARDSLVPSPRVAEVEENNPAPGEEPTRIAVVGGGIAGLSAAWALVKDKSADVEVTIYEASPEVGGKFDWARSMASQSMRVLSRSWPFVPRPLPSPGRSVSRDPSSTRQPRKLRFGRVVNFDHCRQD